MYLFFSYKTFKKGYKPFTPFTTVIMTNEELHNLEAKAWRGELDYSKFHAVEYKFMSVIEKLGALHRNDKIATDLLRPDVVDARKVHEMERRQLDNALAVYGKYQDAVMRADQLVNKIHKSANDHDQETVLDAALECVELLIGEDGLKNRILKYLGKI